MRVSSLTNLFEIEGESDPVVGALGQGGALPPAAGAVHGVRGRVALAGVRCARVTHTAAAAPQAQAAEDLGATLAAGRVGRHLGVRRQVGHAGKQSPCFRSRALCNNETGD